MSLGPGPVSPYRCGACGNKTRFDVYETRRVRSFHHQTLGGEVTVEEEQVLESSVESVQCRWCGAAVAQAGDSLATGPPRKEIGT
jgi:hypothetical protein